MTVLMGSTPHRGSKFHPVDLVDDETDACRLRELPGWATKVLEAPPEITFIPGNGTLPDFSDFNQPGMTQNLRVGEARGRRIVPRRSRADTNPLARHDERADEIKTRF